MGRFTQHYKPEPQRSSAKIALQWVLLLGLFAGLGILMAWRM